MVEGFRFRRNNLLDHFNKVLHLLEEVFVALTTLENRSPSPSLSPSPRDSMVAVQHY